MIRVKQVSLHGTEVDPTTRVVLEITDPDLSADRELLYKHARFRGWVGAELLAQPYDEDGAR